MAKRIISLIFIFCVISLNVLALPSPTGEFFVNDFANVIDTEVENHIYNISAQIQKKTKAQIVVVTVDSLEGMTDSEYARKLGREWGIGDKEKDNGFLMLISTGDRALRFEVGYGLEGALPDGKCGRIMDESMMPYLSENNYSKAVLAGYDRVIAEVCNEYGIEIPKEVNAAPMSNNTENPASVIIFIIIMILLFIFYFKAPPSSRRFIFFGGGFGGHGGSFGGGHSGGFSGGGGSFGGGGSSRKF